MKSGDYMNRPATFAERLNSAIQMKNITKAELSRRTGISKSSLTRYTKGDWEGKQDAVFAIARALNVSEAWLMGYDVPMSRTDNLIIEPGMDRSKLANMLANICFDIPEDAGDADYHLLAAKSNRFLTMNIFLSSDQDLLFQEDFSLGKYREITKDYPEYIPLIRKLLCIFASNQRDKINILEKLFGDYDDHYDEMTDIAAQF